MELNDKSLIEHLEQLVSDERLYVADVIEHIKEVDRRRLYLAVGYTSLFAYLTKSLRYAPSSAQRRIDAARMLGVHPEIRAWIERGDLNVTQVGLVAQGLRQKQKESPEFVCTPEVSGDILSRVKNTDVLSTQRIIAQCLNMEIRANEVQTLQRDDSLRVELTLTREQFEEINRVKEVISHVHPHPTWAELLSYLVGEFLKRKDPEREIAVRRGSTSKTEVAVRERGAVPATTRRAVFRRDRVCQWRDSSGGEVCGSRFQLQVDHRQPIWAGGGNDLRNLQLLCSTHNQLKYKRESGTRPI